METVELGIEILLPQTGIQTDVISGRNIKVAKDAHPGPPDDLGLMAPADGGIAQVLRGSNDSAQVSRIRSRRCIKCGCCDDLPSQRADDTAAVAFIHEQPGA